MVRVIKILIVLIVAADLVYVAGRYAFRSPRIVAFSLGMVGRTPDYPYSQIAHSLEKHSRQKKAVEEMMRNTRVLRTDPAGLMLIETPMGRYWHPGTDTSLIPVLLVQLLAQEQSLIYTDEVVNIHPGDVVLDCGAHVGVFTRPALDAGAKLVVAIEPAPENVECLRRNFAPEIAAGRVIVYPKGVWNKDDFLTLYTNTNSAGDSFVLHADATGHSRIPLTTIDEIVSEFNLQKVDFIKMDIKGAEREALRGAVGTLKKFKPRLAVAAEHLEGDEQAIPTIVIGARGDYRVRYGESYIRDFRVAPATILFY